METPLSSKEAASMGSCEPDRIVNANSCIQALLARIVSKNNEGVEYLNRGEHESARTTFKTTLELTTQALLLQDQLGTESQELGYGRAQSSNTDENGIEVLQLPRLHREIGRPPADVDGERMNAATTQINPEHAGLTSTTGSYVYSCALMLSTTEEQQQQQAQINRNYDSSFLLQETVAIMFNLALVHHWRGIKVPSTAGTLLPKALRLYEMALNLCRSDRSTRSGLVQTSLIELALMNNMGQIHYELCNYSATEQCFQSLKHLLMDAGGAVLIKDNAVQRGFLMNLLLLDHQTHFAPAA